ncbi:MAG: biopolymer transporter ExbD [Pseudomonadota bacterium]|nr:MAG: biopolymer transporter ExbD [Pseudomonadota bacterium]
MSGTEKNRIERLRALRTLVNEEHERELPQVKSDINVTPLVDVVLVLLIIFMVVTPMIASGVAVDLPRTVHHSRKPDDGKDIIISITQDKRLYVGGTRIGKVEDLGRAVTDERRKYPDKSIFLKADARAPYGAVRKAMDELQKADIEDIVIGTEERKQEQ